jgi:hypothetical protein
LVPKVPNFPRGASEEPSIVTYLIVPRGFHAFGIKMGAGQSDRREKHSLVLTGPAGKHSALFGMSVFSASGKTRSNTVVCSFTIWELEPKSPAGQNFTLLVRELESKPRLARNVA